MLRIALIAAAAIAATPASAALVTSLNGSTAVTMPTLNYFGPGPQALTADIEWTSTNDTRQGGSVFGYESGYGFSANGFWSGFPMAGVNSNNNIYGVIDTMSFTLTSPTKAFGGRINWVGDNVDVTISAYDAMNNLLESHVVANAGGNVLTPDRFYAIYRSQGDIARFAMTAGYIAIADIEVGGAVPEPATWAMLIAGFGLVGAASRRRRLSLSRA